MRLKHGLAALAGAAMLTGALHFGVPAHAGIEIKVPVPPLPPLLFPKLPDPRDLIPIPKAPAFFVPDIDVDIVFQDGYWWTPRDGRWLRSRDYRGPYVVVPLPQVPAPIVRLPPRFRTHYGKEKRIPYGQWKKSHGGKWEHRDRDRHGDRDRDRGRDGDRDRDHDRDRDRDHDRGRDRGRGRGH